MRLQNFWNSTQLLKAFKRRTDKEGSLSLEHSWPPELPSDTIRALWLGLRNQGQSDICLGSSDNPHGFFTIYLNRRFLKKLEIPKNCLSPGEVISVHCILRTPNRAGRHRLRIELTDSDRSVLQHLENASFYIVFETRKESPSPGALMFDQACQLNTWFSLPSQGISWSSSGQAYPLFARHSKGCHLTDIDGRTYLDYIMGWGCALLGHANERIQQAIIESMTSGAIPSLPHPLEMEVSRKLCEDIPCAEMVLFGKNGSDVCTAAVRLARRYTGRTKILVCGYHGWQDWYVEKEGFAHTGVPEHSEQLVYPFPFNDLEQFQILMETHKGRIAAVMLEPAGPVEGLNGPLRDADPGFLKAVAATTRQEGALLVFDEIITGFRYPGGSVQQATGVIPDLACFGKALSAGMPLSALVGRRDIFQSTMPHIFYGPTFKGEAYSFAAANEALNIYKELDVPGHIWDYGTRLKTSINQLCKETGVAAELIGPPFRMLLSFKEADPQTTVLMRTLVQQELVKQSLITYMGVMLPSLAHNDQSLDETVVKFKHTLEVLAMAHQHNSFAKYLEIPPMTY
jgi:glutamate-1-semialdehyde 2,1-aminomutase